jgi:nucleoside diphosphate kinase
MPTKHCSCRWLKVVGLSIAVAGASAVVWRFMQPSNGGAASATATAAGTGIENQALLFIKPHGQVEGIAQFVEAELKGAGLRIVKSGTLPGAYIDEKGAIDAHYSAIGTYAMKMQPKDLPISESKKKEFEEKFGVAFDVAATSGKMLNTAQALVKFSWTNPKMGAEFEKAKGKTGFKLAPGCYVAFLEEQQVYVINGFYATMREEYVAKSALVSWYIVSWPETSVSWADFRAKILGATDPTAAESSSIRAKILASHTSMKLPFVPNTGKNCLHGSASPLEALNERRIWTGASVASDSFGAMLLAAGVTPQQVDWMCSNPNVDGKPLFDLVEDTNTSECLAKLVEVAKSA